MWVSNAYKVDVYSQKFESLEQSLRGNGNLLFGVINPFKKNEALSDHPILLGPFSSRVLDEKTNQEVSSGFEKRVHNVQVTSRLPKPYCNVLRQCVVPIPKIFGKHDHGYDMSMKLVRVIKALQVLSSRIQGDFVNMNHLNDIPPLEVAFFKNRLTDTEIEFLYDIYKHKKEFCNLLRTKGFNAFDDSHVIDVHLYSRPDICCTCCMILAAQQVIAETAGVEVDRVRLHVTCRFAFTARLSDNAEGVYLLPKTRPKGNINAWQASTLGLNK